MVISVEVACECRALEISEYIINIIGDDGGGEDASSGKVWVEVDVSGEYEGFVPVV